MFSRLSLCAILPMLLNVSAVLSPAKVDSNFAIVKNSNLFIEPFLNAAYKLGEDCGVKKNVLIPELDLTELPRNDNCAMAVAKYVELAKSRSESVISVKVSTFEAASFWIPKFHSGSVEMKLKSDRKVPDDRKVFDILQLLPGSAVTSLNLDFTPISNENAHALAEVLPKTGITSLVLAGNYLRGEGISAIANVLSETVITTLDVFFNKIGKKGAFAIAKAIEHPNSHLSTLLLTNVDFGLDELLDIAECVALSKSLTSFQLKDYMNFGVFQLRAIKQMIGDSFSLDFDRGIIYVKLIESLNTAL